MQNKLLKIARMGLALVILSFGALPALAQSCEGWENEGKEYWEAITLEQIQTCLNNGADIKAQNNKGDSPLHHIASSNANPEIIKILVKAGANLNMHNELGMTPLHGAGAQSNHLEVIMALIDVGADVNAQGRYRLPNGQKQFGGWTPLHWAASDNENPEIIMIMLKAGADGKIENDIGQTPFDLAKDNAAIKGTDAYWALNEAQY